MQLFLISIFWICAVTVAYTFAGYPLAVACLGRLVSRRFRTAAADLSVSVIVVAHNEASRIEARIRNLLACSAAGPPLEIIVVSDGSADETVRSAKKAADPSVTIVDEPARAGKAVRLNQAFGVATGDIVILTDVRQTFPDNTIARLVSAFGDPQVGAVSGSLEINPAQSSVGAGVDSYWKLEKLIRNGEAAFDSCIGCTGAVYAIRRKLFQAIPGDTILDDVVIPMQIAMAGHRVLFDSAALAYDSQSLEPASESRRKRRTLAGNFQMLCRYPGWLLPWKNRLWWQLISHKYLRLFSPFLLLIAFVANLVLLPLPFFRMIFLVQASFYALALIGLILPRIRVPIFSLPSGFVFLNWMAVRGLILFLKRNPAAAWRVAGSPSND